MNISAIIPAYNEKGNVEELVERLHPQLERHCSGFDICFVYQGTDGGAEALQSLQSEYSNLRVLHHEEPLGVGRAYQKGFENVPDEATHVLTMDADLNHRPEELYRFIEAEADANIVIGSRFINNGDFRDLESWRKFASPFAAKVISLLFSLSVNDVSSGYRLYDASVIRSIRGELSFADFEFYPEVLIRAGRKGYGAAEVPITYDERKHGQSKMNELQTALGYATMITTMKFDQVGKQTNTPH